MQLPAYQTPSSVKLSLLQLLLKVWNLKAEPVGISQVCVLTEPISGTTSSRSQPPLQSSHKLNKLVNTDSYRELTIKSQVQKLFFKAENA